MQIANQQDQFSFLLEQIEGRLRRLDEAITWYRKVHFRGQMAVVVLSALVTIVAGLKLSFDFEGTSSNIVLVLGALLSVISTWGAFFSPKESWHLNAKTYGRLRALQASLRFQACSPDFSEDGRKRVAEAFAEYQEILAEHNTEWLSLRSKTK
jgi:hypothetical protein